MSTRAPRHASRSTALDRPARPAWKTPWDNGDPITKFQIRQKADTAAFGAWADILNSGATTTGDTVTSLTNGIPYTFEVRAVNGIGYGSESNDVTVTPVEVVAPTGSSVEITSEPHFDIYGRNEYVEVTVTFDAAVDIAGTPPLELDFDGTAKAAACTADTNTTTTVCSYRVALGDSAPNGIAIAANKLTGGTVTATGSTTVSANLDHAAVPIDAGHKVDGIRPTLVTTGSDAPTDGTKVILTFTAGDTTKTVSVPITDDAEDDGGETFTLTLGNASGAALGNAEATGTIRNTETAAELSAHFGVVGSDPYRGRARWVQGYWFSLWIWSGPKKPAYNRPNRWPINVDSNQKERER